jgi:uncharacterized protein YjiS (DUF1127 family)
MPFDPVSYTQPSRGRERQAVRAWTAALPLAKAVHQLVARAAAIRQLRRLDDRLLRDIGVERGNIADAVDEMLSAGGRTVRPA